MRAADVIRGHGLAILAAGIPGAVSIWSKPSKSTWHIPAADAAQLADDHPKLLQLLATSDLYVSPGIRPLGLATGQAGKQNELVGLLGFAADVDAWSIRRAHQNLPKTLEDIEAIIEAAPCLPSLVVKSGTGESLHPWWAFDKAEAIRGPADLIRLKRASKKFHEAMHARAAELGFHLDRSDKLNQWLRLPGSMNRKVPDSPAPVQVIWTGREYSFDELAPDGRRTSVDLPTVPPIQEPEALTIGKRTVYDEVRAVASRVRPDHRHKDAIEKILRGESFAGSGDRDSAMYDTVSTIIFSMSRTNPAFADRDLVGWALVQLYTPSFQTWADESTATKTLDERIEKFGPKIVSAFEDRDAKDADRVKTAEVIRRALRMSGQEVPDEKKISIDQLQQLAIIQYNNAFYVHGFGAQTKKHPLPPGFYGPFIEKATLPALADLWENCPKPFDLTYWTEPTKKNPEGVLKQKTVPGLMREYGSLALNVIGDLSLTKSYFDIETRIFHEAICSPRELEPTFDPIFDEYLHVTFEDAYDKFVDYLSYFLRLDVAIGAPYLEGPSGAGKGALVAGLSRFWGTTGPTDYERIAAADFNAFRVPFIVLDEGLTMSRKTSAHIRHLIATGAHTINPKGFAQYVVNGHVRVMFTANNKHVFAQITANEELSEDDIEAISKRFIYFRMSDDAPRWLEERNGKDKIVTKAWVEGDGIAKHVLWLNQNRQAQVVPGKRFIVEGESSEIHRALVTRGEKRGLILEWLAHFATNPDPITRFYATTKKECLATIGNGELLVNTRAVSENWTIYGEKSPCLTTTMIGRILGQISTRVRLGYDGGDTGVRFHKINFDHVLDWAGGDAQIGDLRKMHENFNREIEK